MGNRKKRCLQWTLSYTWGRAFCEDFKMRGSGEIFGEKQSGFSKTFAISLLATSSKITGEKFAPSVNSFMSETASLLRKSWIHSSVRNAISLVMGLLLSTLSSKNPEKNLRP